MHCSKETVIRTVVLLISLINQILTVLGKNPLPFSDAALYEGLSLAFTAGASLWAWWKNNSFTAEAVEADKYLHAIKAVSAVAEAEE